MALTFPRGVFTISLDFELIWGTRDYAGTESFRYACVVEREQVIERLLGLFVRYEIPATWCIVGHLFLDHCEEVNGRKHADALPANPTGELLHWFDDDPATNESSAPTFYGASLVEKIRRCGVSQEIGSHSFAHMIFDEPYCTREAATRDIAKCVAIASESALTLRSFVYPRNRIAYTDVLRDNGFTSYRGAEPQWYHRGYIPRQAQRAFHLASVVLASTPPTVMPLNEEGIWNIPGSMIFLPMHGIRRYIPASRRAARAVRGLDRAAKERRIFHLWFHPTNLSIEIEPMFAALERILIHAKALRDAGALDVMTMMQIAGRASAAQIV
jgi:peptidoglycan/xylan/chitin deacetylase (PgdA/CDA1 family)